MSAIAPEYYEVCRYQKHRQHRHQSPGQRDCTACTVSTADTQAVLVALEVLVEHLSEGEIVRLDDFGSFQISTGSEGVETEAIQCFHD
ncbi:MAG: hypothetical protein LBK03_08735 [Bacteroidales bacterium]|nr:hypothetical protein [Bacteroidales bacterium]